MAETALQNRVDAKPTAAIFRGSALGSCFAASSGSDVDGLTGAIRHRQGPLLPAFLEPRKTSETRLGAGIQGWTGHIDAGG